MLKYEDGRQVICNVIPRTDDWINYPLEAIVRTFQETVRRVYRSVLTSIEINDDDGIPVHGYVDLARCMGSKKKETRDLAIMLAQFVFYVMDNTARITSSQMKMADLFAEKCAQKSQYQVTKTFRTFKNGAGKVEWTFAQCFADLWKKEKDWNIQRHIKEYAIEYALVTRKKNVPDTVPLRKRGDKGMFYIYKNDRKSAGDFVGWVDYESEENELHSVWKSLKLKVYNLWTVDGLPMAMPEDTDKENKRGSTKVKLEEATGYHLDDGKNTCGVNEIGDSESSCYKSSVSSLATSEASSQMTYLSSLSKNINWQNMMAAMYHQTMMMTNGGTPSQIPAHFFGNGPMMGEFLNKRPLADVQNVGDKTEEFHSTPGYVEKETSGTNTEDGSSLEKTAVAITGTKNNARKVNESVGKGSLVIMECVKETIGNEKRDARKDDGGVTLTGAGAQDKGGAVGGEIVGGEVLVVPGRHTSGYLERMARKASKGVGVAVDNTGSSTISAVDSIPKTGNRKQVVDESRAKKGGKRKKKATTKTQEKGGKRKGRIEKNDDMGKSKKSKKDGGEAGREKLVGVVEKGGECNLEVPRPLVESGGKVHKFQTTGLDPYDRKWMNNVDKKLKENKEMGEIRERLRYCQFDDCNVDILDNNRKMVGGAMFYARPTFNDFLQFGGCCPKCYAEKSRKGLAEGRTRGRRSCQRKPRT